MDLGQIEWFETADRARVESFYLTVGYGVEVTPGDRLLVARSGQSMVAAVRLCAESGTLVLRGMYVAEERRGLGIGSGLLEFSSGVIGSSECWCVPYSHLKDFYSRIGFRECERETTPPFLVERWDRYTASGKRVVVMRKPKSKKSQP